jgi:hypothetical protein
MLFYFISISIVFYTHCAHFIPSTGGVTGYDAAVKSIEAYNKVGALLCIPLLCVVMRYAALLCVVVRWVHCMLLYVVVRCVVCGAGQPLAQARYLDDSHQVRTWTAELPVR